MRATATLAADVVSPRLARNWLAEWLPPWVPQSLRDDAALLISELVTNAVIHAMTTCTVTVDLTDTCLRVEVADGMPRGPVLAETERGESGRGIDVVACVAREWGWRRTEDGKEVWFELPLSA